VAALVINAHFAVGVGECPLTISEPINFYRIYEDTFGIYETHQGVKGPDCILDQQR
jgi:hypothetical protein